MDERRPADPAARRRLLVIDDEPMMIRAIRRLLGDRYDMVTTSDPAQAVAQIAAGARFHVILCDLMMPAMTGMDVYESVLQVDVDQAQRFVFMTGGAFGARTTEFLGRVRNPRIEKPLERAALLAAIGVVDG